MFHSAPVMSFNNNSRNSLASEFVQYCINGEGESNVVLVHVLNSYWGVAV
jgi:hypothetical protein